MAATVTAGVGCASVSFKRRLAEHKRRSGGMLPGSTVTEGNKDAGRRRVGYSGTCAFVRLQHR
jgi:hypothetical protein